MVLNDDRKKNIINACAEYEKRQKAKTKKAEARKRYGSPEADFVVEFLTFIKKYPKHFSLNVIEAKGVYDIDAGRYGTGQVSPGYPDISGNNADGIAMYLEAKAPGKRGNLSAGQYMFLKNKAEMNCFAICFDSINYFKKTYKTWCALSREKRTAYLISELPMPSDLKKILDDDSPIF